MAKQRFMTRVDDRRFQAARFYFTHLSDAESFVAGLAGEFLPYDGHPESMYRVVVPYANNDDAAIPSDAGAIRNIVAIGSRIIADRQAAA